MAPKRDRPFPGFNFLVDLGTGSTDGPDAGFQYCGPISAELDVVEYRNGNEKTNEPRKLTGLSRVADVTLRRGVLGSDTLYEWFNQFRNGDQNALRTVHISLMNEDHTEVVQAWSLRNTRVARLAWGPFDAASSEVGIESLTLAYERLEVEF